MIQLRRSDNMSVFLIFDKDGLTNLIDAMKASESAAASSIQATVDMSVVTLKRKSPTVETTLVIQRGKETQLARAEEAVVWTITDEDRESVISRFEQCAAENVFHPAELISVQVPKNRRLDDLYGEFVVAE